MPKRVVKWFAHHQWMTVTIVILALVIAGFIRVEQIQAGQDRITRCTQVWADQMTERSSTLTARAAERSSALDQLIRTLVISDDDDRRQQFAQALQDYIATSNAYEDALNENPVPAPPALECENNE